MSQKLTKRRRKSHDKGVAVEQNTKIEREPHDRPGAHQGEVMILGDWKQRGDEK